MIPTQTQTSGTVRAARNDTVYSPVSCFVVALTVAVPLEPLARVTVFDAVALFLTFQVWRHVQKELSRLLMFLVVSLVAMGISAYINGSDTVSLIGRAYPAPLLFIETVGYFALASKTNERGLAALVLGAMLGICCHYFYPNDLRVVENPNKFLIGVPLGVAVLAFAALATKNARIPPWPAAAIMVFYAGFCFLIGSRSIGGVFFASGAIILAVPHIVVARNYARIAPFLMIFFAVGLYAFTEFYSYLAVRGFFGDTAAGIAEFQNSFGSILIGGRPEIVVNISGIRDAPFFGVGIGTYPSLYLYEMIRLSVYSQSDILGIDNILYHSAIFATGFESGIFSALFWTLGLYIVLFPIPLLRLLPTSRRAFTLPLLLITAWHLIYSPPIPYNRFVMAIGMAFAIATRVEWKRSLNQPPVGET